MLRSHIDGLEDRRLFAANLANGLLTITGTPEADRVLVSITVDKVHVVESTVTPGQGGARPTVTNTRTSFDRSQVNDIEANLGAGDDRLLVTEFPYHRRGEDAPPRIDVTLNGEAGNDYLVSAGGDDTINGGEGNDVLSADGGKDTVNGGAGNDILLGSSGDDTLNGDSGNDFLLGGAGNDTLNGDDGRDRLDGGRGSDILNGGNGNDAINAVDFSDDDVIDGGAHEPDTDGDVALVDEGDTASNVERTRTVRPRPVHPRPVPPRR